MASHTQEPWRFEAGTALLSPRILAGSRGVATLAREVDGNRIVTLVNLCAGIATDQLEMPSAPASAAERFARLRDAATVALAALAKTAATSSYLNLPRRSEAEFSVGQPPKEENGR